MRFKILILSIIIAIIEIKPFIECCSCLRSSPQQYYCDSDFVALIIARSRIESHNDNLGLAYYDIDLWRIYRSKDNSTNEALMKKKLWTRKHDSMCGTNLVLGEPYVVSGYILGNKARISLCGYKKLWNDMSNEEEAGFISQYKDTCIHNNQVN